MEQTNMAYRTIYVHLDETADCTARIKLAVQIAQRDQATLVGVSLSPGHETAATSPSPELTDADVLIAPSAKNAATRTQAVTQFEYIAAKADLRRYEIYTCPSEDVGDVLRSCATTDGLLVMGLHNPLAGCREESLDFVEYVVLNTGSPALIVPEIWQAQLGTEQILLAWDGSAACYRALHGALALLKHAKRVIMISVENDALPGIKPVYDKETAASMIAQQGLDFEVRHVHTSLHAAHILLEAVEETPSSMVVMGCVAHPHWRGILMGGTTRSMLESCTVPIFMSH
jgi:nucleotide-binding universal stress UspA family protein